MKTAVFIDTMSIQKYIFESNSLKENIGASFNVKSIFDLLEKNHSKQKCYIGGGNALLLFNTVKEAQTAMREWTQKLIIVYPGIIPIATIEENFDEKKFSENRKKLIKKNIENKNRQIPVTTLQSFGITAACTRTDLSAEIYDDFSTKNEKRYISSVSYAKLKNANVAEKDLSNNYKVLLDGVYTFTDQLNELGGSEGENNHIAVVHIDGNDMGELFEQKNNINDIKELSEKLKKATAASFGKMLENIIDDYSEIEKILTLKNNTLPVRPIIIGGDDITFVCDARLSFYLMEIFMKSFEEQEICKENNITCCAGISIVKTKYPFYRAYSMAEQLCHNAKQKRKNKKITESMWDFHISFGGLGDSLQDIRQHEYSTSKEKLYKRPYKLSDMPKLLNCINELIYDKNKKLSQNKIKKLRNMLYQGKNATTEFIKQLGFRNKELPKFEHCDEVKKGFENEATPYLDMIEMTDFCPEFYIKKRR